MRPSVGREVGRRTRRRRPRGSRSRDLARGRSSCALRERCPRSHIAIKTASESIGLFYIQVPARSQAGGDVGSGDCCVLTTPTASADEATGRCKVDGGQLFADGDDDAASPSAHVAGPEYVRVQTPFIQLFTHVAGRRTFTVRIVAVSTRVRRAASHACGHGGTVHAGTRRYPRPRTGVRRERP